VEYLMIKMNRLLLLLGLISLSSCYQQERKCEDFRTGTFLFEQEINGEKHSSTFIRTEDLQIETYQGVTDTATVRWINDCEFVLKKLHPKNMAEEKSIHMKILTTSQDGYIFEYNIVGDPNKQRGEIKRIEDLK